MAKSTFELGRVINNTSLRGSITQLSAVYNQLDGKIDRGQLNKLADLIQTLGDTQREIAVLFNKMEHFFTPQE
jgi:hypothetical protein